MLARTLLSGLLLAVLVSAAGDTRLPDAAMQGDKAAVRSLLKQKIDVNAAQGDGMTALHWAAYKDDLEMARLLLAAGANVKAATREGAITPLFMACTNGSAGMIDALLKAGADANSVKSNGTTALMTAAASGSAESVRLLLDHGADVKAKESAHGQTALMFAAALNRDAVIKMLMAHGAEANAATPARKLERVRFDQDGNIVEDREGAKPAETPTDLKTQVADLQAQVQKLLARVEELEKHSAGATTAAAKPAVVPELQSELDALAHSMGFKAAEYRLAKPRARAGDVASRGPRKVGPDFQGGMTALLYAAREGHMNAARALVEAGVDVNQVSADKISPMLMAIINGHLDIAKYLLDHGADPNLASETGLAPLYATIDVQWAPKTWFPQPSTEQQQVTHLDLMKAILDHKVNVNAAVNEKPWFRSFTNDYTWVDPAGATPFWRAAQASDIVAMRLLVAHGADPKLATKSADTPLMVAAGIGWAANWSVNAPYPALESVQYCLELGSDINAADNRGYTALHGAAYLGNNEMVNYLVSKGAKIDVRSKAGDSAADMANGPTRFGQPHLETVALLEKLGSPNSHNCRSDQCVLAANANTYERPLTPAQQADKDVLDRFAVALGFKSVEYRTEGTAGFGRGYGGGGGGRGREAQTAPTPGPAPEPAQKPPAAAPKPPGGGFE